MVDEMVDENAERGLGLPMRILEWVLIFVAACGLSILIRRFVVDVFVIPSGSMIETIIPGDRVIGEKISYLFRKPEQGEVVTFIDPTGETDTTYIKRVIAVAGDEVDLRDGRLYINGEQPDEPYTRGLPSYALPGYNHNNIEYPYVVPDGHIWCMGDNRTNSNDSRYFGPVKLESVTSRGVVVFWPVSDAHGL